MRCSTVRPDATPRRSQSSRSLRGIRATTREHCRMASRCAGRGGFASLPRVDIQALCQRAGKFCSERRGHTEQNSCLQLSFSYITSSSILIFCFSQNPCWTAWMSGDAPGSPRSVASGSGSGRSRSRSPRRPPGLKARDGRWQKELGKGRPEA